MIKKLLIEGVSAIVLGIIRFWGYAISPLFPPSCRYHPSCSRYAIQAIHTHGICRGVLLAVKRIGRCHPWCDGGFDPVPDDKN